MNNRGSRRTSNAQPQHATTTNGSAPRGANHGTSPKAADNTSANLKLHLARFSHLTGCAGGLRRGDRRHAGAQLTEAAREQQWRMQVTWQFWQAFPD